jgi:hypothetical protein
MGNHPDLSYRGGQQPIVHLQADLNTVIHWADENAIPWAFTNGNASAKLTDFYNQLSQIDRINWNAVQSTNFSDSKIKEGKQAEFLLFDVFPWTLIEKIGTINSTIAARTKTNLLNSDHQPAIDVEPSWYF